MSNHRGEPTTTTGDGGGACGHRSARARAAWPRRPDRSPVGGGALDADQARVVVALVMVALALIYAAQAVSRMGLRTPRIVPLSAAGRAEAVSLLASLIAGVA